MIFNMASGGAMGAINPYAVIGVTYPEGSACTCSKDSLSYMAKDTSGHALFAVPESGTYTVVCTNGTKTATRNVVISTQYQNVNIDLHYGYYLFEENVGASVTFDICGRSASSYAVNEITSEYMHFRSVNDAAYYWTGRVTNQQITLSMIERTYKKLWVEATVIDTNANILQYGLIRNHYTTINNAIPLANFQVSEVWPTGQTTRTLRSIDISAYTGDFYVMICAGGQGAYIHNVFLTED